MSAPASNIASRARCVAVALLFFVVGFGAGCASTNGGNDAALVQRVLDRVLPPDFTGDLRAFHKNAYFNVTIDAKNLRRVGDRWVWDSLTWERNGFVSYGTVTFGKTTAN